MRSRTPDGGLQWPQRRILDWNGKLAHSYLDNSHLVPTYSRDQVGWLKPNGDIGMDDDLDANNWEIKVTNEGGKDMKLSLTDIRALPKIEMITKFCRHRRLEHSRVLGSARVFRTSQRSISIHKTAS